MRIDAFPAVSNHSPAHHHNHISCCTSQNKSKRTRRLLQIKANALYICNMRKNGTRRRDRSVKVNSRPKISCQLRQRRRGTLRRTNNYNKLTMKYRRSCNHSGRRWISWGAWYRRCKGGFHYTWKYTVYQMAICPLLVVSGVWNHRRLSRRLKPPSCRPPPTSYCTS